MALIAGAKQVNVHYVTLMLKKMHPIAPNVNSISTDVSGAKKNKKLWNLPYPTAKPCAACFPPGWMKPTILSP